MTKEYEFLNEWGKTSTLNGILLAETTTEEPHKAWWTEYKVYKTVTGKYVIATYGRSRNPKDKTRVNIIETRDPSAVRDALLLKNKNNGSMYLIPAGVEALKQAMDKDDEIREAYERSDIS